MPNASEGDAQHTLLRVMLAHRVHFLDRQQTVQLIEQWRESHELTLDLQLDSVPLLGEREQQVLEELVELYLSHHDGPLESEILELSGETARHDATAVSDAIGRALSMTTTAPPQAEARAESSSAASVQASPFGDERRFVVKRELARGGLGTVFVAEDRQIPRDVALKEIPRRFAGQPEFTRRFLLEAEITGALEHPGIVPIYAMGQGRNGQPYYAMRLIRGRSLREAIDNYHGQVSQSGAGQRRLEFRRLLSQFTAVCHAIQYAHDRGVLHRDIKPDNIMLGPNNETVVVDWGIAKLLDGDDSTRSQGEAKAGGSNAPSAESESVGTVNETLRMRNRGPASKTTVGMTVGTPAFMSPEQALGWNDSLTAQSDVYSLGATLYYLLAGKVPHASGDAIEAVVAARTGQFPTPRSVRPETPRALEAICRKAMEASARDRYQSPAALASEIESYLADEPVSAWREPFWTRTRRWLRNHRTALAGLSAAVSVAVLMLLTTSVVLTAANGRERAARQEAEKQRDRANQNLKLARSVVDRYLTRIGEDPRLAAAGLEDLRKELFGEAKEFYTSLLAEETADRDLRVDQAWAKFRVAEISAEIDKPDLAVAQYREALTAFQTLDVPKGQADTSFNIAISLQEGGHKEEAEKALAETVELCAKLVERFPEDADLRRRSAACLVLQSTWLRALDKTEEAEAKLVQALPVRKQLAEQHEGAFLKSELAETYEVLALIDQDLHRYPAAAKKLELAKALREQLVREHRDSPFYRNALVVTITSIADLQLTRGELDDAKKNYLAALAAQNALMDSLVRVTSYRQRLASIHNNLAALLATRGEGDEAIEQYRASIRVNQTLVNQRRRDPLRKKLLAMSFTNLADLVQRKGDIQESLDLQVRARTIYAELLAADKKNPQHRASLAECQRNIGDIDLHRQRYKEAEKNFREAIRLLTEVEMPSSTKYLHSLGSAHHSLGMLYRALKRQQDARKAYTKAAAIRERLVTATKGLPDYRASLASTQINLAHLAVDLGDFAEAERMYNSGIATVQPAPRTHNESRRMLCSGTASRGLFFGTQNKNAEAVRDLQAALELDRGELTIAIKLNLSYYQALVGDHASAFEHCATLRPQAKGVPQVLYRLAGTCSYCITAARSDKELDAVSKESRVAQYADLALKLLEDALQSGQFKTPAAVKDLDSGPQWKGVQEDGWFKTFRAKVK